MGFQRCSSVLRSRGGTWPMQGSHPCAKAAGDDVLDALAVALTGHLGEGARQTIPGQPDHDLVGLPMEMVYWSPPPSSGIAASVQR